MTVTKADTLRFGAALVLGWVLAPPASAEIAADQIARLGQDLTPLGGERAGNAEGTIPEWAGGITEPPAGYTVGEHQPRPLRRGPAALRHRRGQPRRAPRPALARASADAGDLPELQHAGLSHPAQCLRAATDLRRDARERRHRKARGRRQRRRRRGDRHSLPCPGQRPGGDLEPPAALPGRDVGLRHRPGPRSPGAAPTRWSSRAWRPSCATPCRA